MSRGKERPTPHYSTERHFHLRQHVVYTIKGIAEKAISCIIRGVFIHSATTAGILHSPYTESAKYAKTQMPFYVV